MQESIAELKGRPVFYRSRGEGPALVLLHGFAEDGRVWREQYDRFPAYRLIIPDLPGSGRSPAQPDMTIEGLADTIHALCEELDAGSCVLVGHSMGGYIALAFAERHPQSLAGLGLFHSSAFADTEEKKATRRKGIDFMEKHGAFEFLQTTTPNVYSDETKKARPELVQAQLATVKDMRKEALVAYYEAMMQRPDRTDVLRSSAVPVLFILGRSDTAVPLADGLKQCHLPATAVVYLFEASGHMGMQEEKERAGDALEAFAKICLPGR